MFRLPKVEDKFTMIPNVVLDELIQRIGNLSAIKCYIFMIRKTYGWGKTGDWISTSQLIKSTGLSKQSVITGMKWLEENGYIWVVKSGVIGAEKKMYFLCTEDTEEMELMYREGIISADKFYELMMNERKIVEEERKRKKESMSRF